MQSLPFTLAMLLVGALGACTGSAVDRPEPSATPTVSSEQLLGAWGADPKTGTVQGEPWLDFRRDGKFGGYDGCNSIGGRWTLDPDTNAIRVDRVATTAVGCTPSTGMSHQGMTFDGQRITYALGNGKRKAMLPRQPGVVVLVSEAMKGGRGSGITGRVEVVGGCLGIDGSVVVWPHGTETLAYEPLTITIPRKGSYAVGDEVQLPGGQVVERSSGGTGTGPRKVNGARIPVSCAKRDIFLARRGR